LRDEDEFADHRQRFGYPEDLVTEAQAAARKLLVALGDGSEPYATQYRKWLADVVE
jgi:protein associated with RNAse G/E